MNVEKLSNLPQTNFIHLKRYFHKNSVIIKILSSYLLLTLLLFSIFPFFLKDIFSKQYMDKLISTSTDIVSQSYETANTLITSTFSRFYRKNTSDSVFINALSSNTFDTMDILDICNNLRQEALVSPIVSSIYIYNFQADRVFSSRTATATVDDFYDTGATHILKNFEDYKDRLFISRSYENNNMISIFYNTLSNSGDLISSLVVNIDSDVLGGMLTKHDNDSLNNIYIIDNNGFILLPYTTDSNVSLEETSLFAEVKSSQLAKGSFTSKINEQQLLTTYIKSDSLGWNFVSVSNLNMLLSDLNIVNKYIIIVSILFILIAILLAAYFTNVIYNPFYNIIKKLKQENNNEENQHLNEFDYLKNTLDTMNSNIKVLEKNEFDSRLIKKQKYITELINADTFIDSQSINEMSILGIEVNSPNYVVLVFSIDSFNNLIIDYAISDISTLKYGIFNIITELLSKSYYIEAISTQENQITVIAPVPNDSIETLTTLNNLVNHIHLNIVDHLGVSVSSSNGNIIDNLNLINISYKNAVKSLQYKILTGNNSIINYYDYESRDLVHGEYPYYLEELILSGIKKKQAPIIKEHLNKFFLLLNSLSIDEINLYIYQLILSIDKTLKSSNSFEVSNTIFSFKDIYNNCEKLSTLHEVEKFLYAQLHALTENITSAKAIKNKQVTNKILTCIEQGYADPSFSIEVISTHVELSPNYIRTIFKDITNKSLSAYITEYRINKAKDLLASTSYTAKDVSSMVGFNDNRYFYAVFKKHTGMTSEEYKKHNNNNLTLC